MTAEEHAAQRAGDKRGPKGSQQEQVLHLSVRTAASAAVVEAALLEHDRRRRKAGDWHAAAQRNLFNRLRGQLYHSWSDRNTY